MNTNLCKYVLYKERRERGYAICFATFLFVFLAAAAAKGPTDYLPQVTIVFVIAFNALFNIIFCAYISLQVCP